MFLMTEKSLILQGTLLPDELCHYINKSHQIIVWVELDPTCFHHAGPIFDMSIEQ